LQIAEAGLDYYRWFLAHFPTDLQDGTASSSPYVHVYSDPEEGEFGEFSLDISGNLQSWASDVGGNYFNLGHTYDDSSQERVVYGKYARPSVAEYS
jgi:hypothetical protein